MRWIVLFVLCAIFSFDRAMAQDQQPDPDELYSQARIAAFENKDYTEAIRLLKAGLAQAPDYLEMRVFLGRVYTFSDSLTLARAAFQGVLLKEAGHEEASLGYANLEYWNNNAQEALKLVNSGLELHPESQPLNILKAKILYQQKEPQEASSILDYVLDVNPGNSEARSLQQSQNSLSSKNAIGVSYEYVYFDKRFDDPWHIAFVDYSRQTKAGLFTARLNYANRFNTNAIQGEVEAYPRISDRFYGFVNLGFSNDSGVFPRLRGGLSLYANLPKAYELEGGIRYLVFEEDQLIYTLGAGKYLGNFWFNMRGYLIPNNSEITGSLVLTTRYYLGGRDNYLGFRLGTGLSPDNSANSILFDGATPTRLKSNNIAAFWRTPIAKLLVLNLEAGLEDQQFNTDERGLQFNALFGLIRRF